MRFQLLGNNVNIYWGTVFKQDVYILQKFSNILGENRHQNNENTFLTVLLNRNSSGREFYVLWGSLFLFKFWLLSKAALHMQVWKERLIFYLGLKVMKEVT